MNAFDEGRVGLFVASMANWNDSRLANAARVFDGMFTDVFLPRSAKRVDMDKVRATPRPNGLKLRAQLWTEPHEMDAVSYAKQTFDDIVRLAPGVCDLDIEENEKTEPKRVETVYRDYIAETLWRLRTQMVGADWMARFPLGVNIAPYKAAFLPKDWFTDPLVYWTSQVYYGDVSRVSEAEAYQDLEDAGVPKERRRICYGAATEHRGPDGKYLPAEQGGKRQLALPTVFYKGRPVRKLRRGVVFSDDLLAELGLL